MVGSPWGYANDVLRGNITKMALKLSKLFTRPLQMEDCHLGNETPSELIVRHVNRNWYLMARYLEDKYIEQIREREEDRE